MLLYSVIECSVEEDVQVLWGKSGQRNCCEDERFFFTKRLTLALHLHLLRQLASISKPLLYHSP